MEPITDPEDESQQELTKDTTVDGLLEFLSQEPEPDKQEQNRLRRTALGEITSCLKDNEPRDIRFILQHADEMIQRLIDSKQIRTESARTYFSRFKAAVVDYMKVLEIPIEELPPRRGRGRPSTHEVKGQSNAQSIQQLLALILKVEPPENHITRMAQLFEAARAERLDPEEAILQIACVITRCPGLDPYLVPGLLNAYREMAKRDSV